MLFTQKFPKPTDFSRTYRTVKRWRRTFQIVKTAGVFDDLMPHRVPEVIRKARRIGAGPGTIHTLQAAMHPDKPAFRDALSTLTYAEADRQINRLANVFVRHLGITQSSTVVLILENRVDYALAWFALFRLGASVAHASYRSTAVELQYLVNHSNAEIVVCSNESYKTVCAWHRRFPNDQANMLLLGKRPQGRVPRRMHLYETLSANKNDEFPSRGPVRSRNQNIVYTSGTTGKPKGALRDFSSVQPAEFLRLLNRLPLRFGDRHLVVAPMYHSAAQAFTLLHAGLGGEIHYAGHFEPEKTLQTLSEQQIHSVFMVPTMLRRILDLEPELLRHYATPSLRCILCGAAPFPQELRMRAIQCFGPGKIFDFYGATELGWVTTISGTEMLRKPGSVGRPNSGQFIKIMDKNGCKLPKNEVGLIYVRNDQIMKGYLHDEQATNRFRCGEWMTVEDLGYLDEDGYLYLSGRARDMVISGGVNIYPIEIEEVLVRHPDVGDAAVIGLPDETWGERLVAVIVPKQGRRIDTAKIETQARRQLAAYKIPKQWEVLAELPRNPTGKVLKRELREKYAGTDTSNGR